MMTPELTTLNALLGACVVLTVLLSLILIGHHCVFHWRRSAEQKPIIVIISMAPVFAVVSYIGLFDFRGSETLSVFLDAIKESYFCLVIFNFCNLLLAYSDTSGRQEGDLLRTLQIEEIHRSFPMSLFKPHEFNAQKSQEILKNWRLQYVLFRVISSALIIVLQLRDMYPDWLWWTFNLILLVSFNAAGEEFTTFYHAFSTEGEHKPHLKFLFIKWFDRLSFWQGLILRDLLATCTIKSNYFLPDVVHKKHPLENKLVTGEMFFFAIIQLYVYSVTPYNLEIVNSVTQARPKNDLLEDTKHKDHQDGSNSQNRTGDATYHGNINVLAREPAIAGKNRTGSTSTDNDSPYDEIHSGQKNETEIGQSGTKEDRDDQDPSNKNGTSSTDNVSQDKTQNIIQAQTIPLPMNVPDKTKTLDSGMPRFRGPVVQPGTKEPQGDQIPSEDREGKTE